jgi:hypothetical protein
MNIIIQKADHSGRTVTVFARSNAGIVSSNPIQNMDVCIVYVYSMYVLFCV